MRKLISLGLLVLLLSLLVSPVIAGSVDDCDEVWGDEFTPGLYGLCIAFWSAANGNSQARILENFRKRATGPNDPTDMPGHDGTVACPCWTPETLDELTDGLQGEYCGTSETFGYEFVQYVGGGVQIFAGDLFFSPIGGTSCAISVGALEISTDSEQDVVCRAGVIALQDELIELEDGTLVPVFPIICF